MTGFLEIGSDTLSIAVSPYGAALARVWLAGHDTSLVLGLPHAADYADAPHAIGVVVGPIAGRVSGASVRIGGTRFQMPANTPPDCLHSGPEGVQHRLWQVEDHSAAALTLRCDLPGGACGLPGNRTLRAHYSLRGASLTLTLEAQSDADTLINAASHAYWALDPRGDLTGHRVTVHADTVIDTGPDLIPTGARVPVEAGPKDFTAPRSPVDGPPLDNTFVLQDRPGANLIPALSLTSGTSGITLDVHTNQPGLVLYSGAGLPQVPAPPNTPPIHPFSALAIEAQGWPDAPNQPEFPSILLRKGDTSIQTVRFNLRLP